AHAVSPTVPPAPPLRVMVVGDGTGTALVRGMRAAHDRRLVIDDGTEPCPLLSFSYTRAYPGAPVRNTTTCSELPYRWLQAAQTFKPDVILVVDSVADGSDFADSPRGPWKNLLYIEVDGQLLPKYGDVATALRTTGAVVAWATAPSYGFIADPAAHLGM